MKDLGREEIKGYKLFFLKDIRQREKKAAADHKAGIKKKKLEGEIFHEHIFFVKCF